jgi:hypothetical protein
MKTFQARVGAALVIGAIISALVLFRGSAHSTPVLAQQGASSEKPAAVGTSAILGKIDGVEIEVTVQGPATEVTP